MPHPACRFLIVLGTAVAALVGRAAPAGAGCNLIPVARSGFASTLGGVDSPISAPGRTVELTLSPCDASAGFDPDPADNVVALTFEPPGGGGNTTVAVTAGITVPAADCVLPDGRCRTLRFTVPDTTAELPPYGLAGPARAVVTDANTFATLADVGSLYQPTSGCDRQAETVFERFTLLPAPNLMADVVAGTLPEVLATVDGGGNLLVPFDHWGGGGAASVLADLPSSPIAMLLAGAGDLPAQGAGDPNLILDVLAAQPDSARLVRSFTLAGRPLPPLLRLTANGDLFGTTDTIESVLRFARRAAPGDPALFDVSDRLFMGRGPIRIAAYRAERRTPVPLAGLRPGGGAIAYVRDEAREGIVLNGDGLADDRVVQVLDAATGQTTNTARAVWSPQDEVFAHGDLVAFLESEYGQGLDYAGDGDLDDAILRVYAAGGTERTGAPLQVARERVIDEGAIGLGADRVYFRGPDPVVQQVPEPSYLPRQAVLSPDGAHLYWASLPPSGVSAYARDAATGKLSVLQFMPIAGVNDDPWAIALSPDGAHVYVHSTFTGGAKISVFARNAGTGLLAFVEELFEGIGGVSGIDGYGGIVVSPDGAHVYVGTDGVGGALTAFARNAATGTLTFVESEPAPNANFTGALSPDGLNLYAADAVNGGVYVFTRDPGTGALTRVETGTVGRYATIVSPDGRFVYATDASTIIEFARGPEGRLGDPVASFPAGSSVSSAPGAAFSPGGTRLYIGDSTRVLERDVVSGSLGPPRDLDLGTSSAPAVSGDGRYLYVHSGPVMYVLRTDLDLRIFDAASGMLRPTSANATYVATGGRRAMLLVPEEPSDGDLNGDGDAGDHVVHLVDTTGPTDTVASLDIAGRRVALGDTLAAFTVPEGSEGDRDRNGDADRLDAILGIAEIGPLANARILDVAADEIAVSGENVVFARPEWAEPPTGLHCIPVPSGCDLDGDGLANSLVLHVYRHRRGGVGTIENVGLPVPETQFGAKWIVVGPYVVFQTDESAVTGDLNGDGAIDDSLVVQVLDLANDTIAPANTGTVGIACVLAGCEPRLPYRIDPVRGTVAFLVAEALEGSDLDGDGGLGVVIQVFNVRSGDSHYVSLVRPPIVASDYESLPNPMLDGQIVYATVPESQTGNDLNGDGLVTDDPVVVLAGDSDGDGVFDDADTCVEVMNGDEIDADGDGLGDTACDPNPATCPAAPLAGCRTPTAPGQAAVQLKDDPDDAKDQLKWSWNKGAATSLADFGNPVDGVATYRLCVYDPAEAILKAAVFPGRVCDPAKGTRCWSAAGKHGFKFKDKAGTQAGITQIALKAGAAGKAKILIKGKGLGVPMPTLPVTLPLRVQLIVNDGPNETCWEATYDTAKNDGSQLSAKSH